MEHLLTYWQNVNNHLCSSIRFRTYVTGITMIPISSSILLIEKKPQRNQFQWRAADFVKSITICISGVKINDCRFTFGWNGGFELSNEHINLGLNWWKPMQSVRLFIEMKSECRIGPIDQTVVQIGCRWNWFYKKKSFSWSFSVRIEGKTFNF